MNWLILFFRQTEKKYNIVKEKENLTYLQNHVFHFNGTKSHPLKESDFLIVPNLPLMVIKLSD